MEFKKMSLKENLLSTLTLKGYTEPTKIQQEFIPVAQKGKDILAKSQTGSGKTLAYVLSILNNLDADGIGALIVAPTKELCTQIKDVISEFVKFTNLKVCKILGGSDFTRQRLNLKTANIVVGTTGRLLDHIERRTLKLHKLKYLVLDEADEMLDMGFIDDIRRIVKATPKRKQTFMLSATFSQSVKDIANEFLQSPEIIETTKENTVVSGVNQCYILCLKKGKLETLLKFLRSLYKEKTIIFVNTKKMAEEIFKKLQNNNIKSEFLHGDLQLKERIKVVNNFKSYNNDVLIATDVASRGLDISNVEYVINYDLPQDVETYIHRLGRTARAGKTGMSLSLVNSEKQLDYLMTNFSKYNLVELKVKRDERTNQNIFVKTKTGEFDFEAKKPIKKDVKTTTKNAQDYNKKDRKIANKNKKFSDKKQKTTNKNNYKKLEKNTKNLKKNQKNNKKYR
ncbi:MAG: DEAD/DEAH box helicase [Christensenellales bacterium]